MGRQRQDKDKDKDKGAPIVHLPATKENASGSVNGSWLSPLSH